MLQTNTERLLPILVYIQTHLEHELSLELLAERAALSPFHFHRLFRATIGETVKQYVQRLRLEQAAFQLKIRDAAIIDIAFNLGYQTHETFTRAFRQRFSTTPVAFRQAQRLDRYTYPAKFHTTSQRAGMGQNFSGELHLEESHEPPSEAVNASTQALMSLNQHIMHYDISRVSVQKLEAIPVAFIRHLGDYTKADMNAFEQLIQWAQQRGLYTGENLLIGIGHDDPSITLTEKVRFDACIQIAHPVTLKESAGSKVPVGYQETPAGLYATVTYVGPYGDSLYQAYAAIFQQMHNHAAYTLLGLPVLEIYRTSRINPEYALNQTDIFVPVLEKKGI